jgi:hypothetical protein
VIRQDKRDLLILHARYDPGGGGPHGQIGLETGFQTGHCITREPHSKSKGGCNYRMDRSVHQLDIQGEAVIEWLLWGPSIPNDGYIAWPDGKSFLDPRGQLGMAMRVLKNRDGEAEFSGMAAKVFWLEMG